MPFFNSSFNLGTHYQVQNFETDRLFRNGRASFIDFESFHVIPFHLITFIQGKYSGHANVDLQTALLQKKSYKITVKIGTMKYVKVKER